MARYPVVDLKEYYLLAWNGVRIWKKLLSAGMKIVGIEENLEAGALGGRLDYLGERAPGRLVVIDWKTGYVERDYDDQLYGYTYLAREHYARDNFAGAIAITAWLRTGLYDVLEISPQLLEGWLERLAKAIDSDGKTPGPHCGFCPLQFECHAHTNAAAQAIAVFTGANVPVSPDALIKAYPMYEVAKKALKNYDGLMRGLVEQREEIELPDGRLLHFREEKRKNILWGTTFLEAMHKHFEVHDLSMLLDILHEAITIKKSAFDQLIRAAAPRRKGGKTLKAVYEVLEREHLIGETKIKKLATKKGKGE